MPNGIYLLTFQKIFCIILLEKMEKGDYNDP